ncbi:unnamed protein product [Moneuplotes crassus]|uniref:Uncharacterized protein n=1 Tax=Euplotes crassus TaxID=5936 RepID=A0AAD2D201_EUPCR|nr:unnamed protein product [Moneuplotes crassus]
MLYSGSQGVTTNPNIKKDSNDERDHALSDKAIQRNNYCLVYYVFSLCIICISLWLTGTQQGSPNALKGVKMSVLLKLATILHYSLRNKLIRDKTLALATIDVTSWVFHLCTMGCHYKIISSFVKTPVQCLETAPLAWLSLLMVSVEAVVLICTIGILLICRLIKFTNKPLNISTQHFVTKDQQLVTELVRLKKFKNECCCAKCDVCISLMQAENELIKSTHNRSHNLYESCSDMEFDSLTNSSLGDNEPDINIQGLPSKMTENDSCVPKKMLTEVDPTK